MMFLALNGAYSGGPDAGGPTGDFSAEGTASDDLECAQLAAALRVTG